MSSLFAIKTKDRVHVVADGASFQADGTMIGNMQKVAPAPHMRMVVAVRGNANWVLIIQKHAEQYASAADLLSDLPAKLADFHRQVAHEAGEFDALLAFHSGGRPHLKLIRSWPDEQGARSFEPIDVPFAWYSPAIVDQHLIDNVATAFSRSPETAARDIINSQRRSGDCPMGGFGELVTVTHDRIEYRLIERWADAPGQKLKIGKDFT